MLRGRREYGAEAVRSRHARAAAAALLRSDPPDDPGPSLAFHAASATLQLARRKLQDALPRDYALLELVDPTTGDSWGSSEGVGDPMGPDRYRYSTASDRLADVDCPGGRDAVAAALAAGSVLHAVIPTSMHCPTDACRVWTTHVLARSTAGGDGTAPAVLIMRAWILAPRDATGLSPSGYWLAGPEDDPVLVDGRGPRPASHASPSAAIRVAMYGAPDATPSPAPSDAGDAVRLEFDGVSLPGWLRAAHASAEPIAPGEPLRCGTLRFFAPARPLP
ncbi:MAG: hypothetical protein HY907_15075 [Deltaproteobacteria bacterium]|nr:hypothetical protein [Deltaproteobacteria bacterium]